MLDLTLGLRRSFWWSRQRRLVLPFDGQPSLALNSAVRLPVSLLSSLLTPLSNRHIDLPVAWPAGTPPQAIAGMEKYLTSTVLALGKVATSTGVPESAYASESDWNEEHWQDVWYGKENYQ